MTTDPRGGTGARAGRRARHAVTVGAAGCALGLLAGCSSPPDYQYVANGDRTIVVKLPASWKSVDPTKVGYPKSTSKQWMAFYDGSGKADPNNFDSKLPISPPDQPVVQMVTLVEKGGTGPVPESVLRDLLTPGTKHAVVKFANQAMIDDTALTDFKTQDQTIDTPQATGVRMQSLFAFNIKDLAAKSISDKPEIPDVRVIVDKIAVADRAGKHIHVIQIWCTAECMQANASVIDQIMSSYTVKAQP